MKKTIYLLIVLIMFITSCIDTDYTIRGYVLDNSNNPIKDVNVSLNSNMETNNYITAEDGFYDISILYDDTSYGDKHGTLTATKEGYLSFTKRIKFSSGGSEEQNIILENE